MTHIRLVQPPREHLDIEQPPIPTETPKRKSSGVRALFAFSVLLTAANLAGIAYTAILMKQMSDFSSEIAKVSQFEQRISQRLETFNDGIHAQFDRLNAGLGGNAFPAPSSRQGRPFYHVPARLLDSALQPQSYQHLSTLTPLSHDGGGLVASPGNDQAGFHDNAASSTRIANFIRTETPDGKVIYRTVE
jgi:hypothetical protein